MQPVDIRSDHLAIVLDILARHVPEAEVWVFGSRAKWLARDTSDLDLCIRAAAPIGFAHMGALREAFEESNLPYKVDVVDWATTAESFRKIIERDKVVVQEAKTGRVIPGEWTPTTLAKVLSFSNGKSSPDRADNLPYPVYGSNGIIGFASETNAEPSTIVIGRVGSYCGSLYFSKEKCWVTDNAIRASAIDDNDAKFLLYLLQTLDLNHWRAGSGQPLLNQTILGSIPTSIPEPDTQRAIAHILGTLDDKIELNRRMNETLEAIARAMFKSWFVDFDPVRAKMNGEPTVSICQRLGLTPDLLALFPDRLVDSELGEIPEGWEVQPLDRVADYLNGLALQKFPPESETEWLPVIKIAQLKKCDVIGADRASRNLKPEYVVSDGDVLFSWSGSLEVDVWCGGRGALNQHLFKVTSANYPKWFYFYWTKHHLAHFQEIAAGKAVTMGHIQRKHLTQALCAVPRKPLMDKLDAIMTPLLEKQIGNRKASRTLAMVRDELLPKLLSGELRVPDAEKTVELMA
ncbi:MAG: restriction endonuclease subunit S [Gallionella sp.]|nr:restriction endonuclease subunit S [Gallionella sp.]